VVGQHLLCEVLNGRRAFLYGEFANFDISYAALGRGADKLLIHHLLTSLTGGTQGIAHGTR